MVLVLARPTVDPSKPTPLDGEGEKHLRGCSRYFDFSLRGNSRDELRVVVFGPRQEAPLAPLEEASEGEFGVAAHVDLIPVRPDIQTHQHDADAHRPIQLAGR